MTTIAPKIRDHLTQQYGSWYVSCELETIENATFLVAIHQTITFLHHTYISPYLTYALRIYHTSELG